MFNLQNYENYHTESSSVPFSNVIVIKNENEEGILITDTILLMNDQVIINNSYGVALYNYYYHIYNNNIEANKSIRTDSSLNIIEELINLNNYFYSLEKESHELYIKQNFGIMMIPFKILLVLFIDSNYLGLDAHDISVKEIIDILKMRTTNYNCCKRNKHNYFTKRGLYDFVRTGMLSDHFVGFRPFTKDEIKEILLYNLNNLKYNKYFKIYLLKDDYFVNNIEILYYRYNKITLYDSCSGYGRDYTEIVISAKSLVEIYDDFIVNEVMRNYIYNEEETLEYLNELLKTC